MSATKAAPEKGKTPEETATAQTAAKFEIAKLRVSTAKLFGVPTSTFDGAFYGRTGMYTVQEAKDIITSWLNKPAAL